MKKTWEKFWDEWGETINGLFGLLIFISVIAVVILGFVSCGKAVEQDYDRTHNSYQEIFEPSGIMNNHPLETLGPIETSGSEFHGQYFSALILASGEVEGKTTTVLHLRFKWQDPSGAYKVMDYPYKPINFRVSPEYTTPQIKLVFTKEKLGEQLSLYNDYTIYDFNLFFNDTVAIDVFLNQDLYDSEMDKLEIE